MDYYPNLTFHIGNIEFTLMRIIAAGYSEPICEHSHGKHFYELYYIESGTGYMFMEKTQKSYPIGPGTFGLTGPGIPHSHYPSEHAFVKDYNLIFSVKPVSRHAAAEDSAIGEAILATPYWMGSDCEHVLPFFKKITEEASSKKPGHEIILKALCQELFVLLVRAFASGPEGKKKNYDIPDLNDNRQVIIDDMFFLHSDTLTLEMLAERLECSPRHASRYISLYYGKSFNELKNDFRMASAAAKLHDMKKPIRDISDELGFSSYDYFDKVFKKYFTLSPSDYRKRLRDQQLK